MILQGKQALHFALQAYTCEMQGSALHASFQGTVAARRLARLRYPPHHARAWPLVFLCKTVAETSLERGPLGPHFGLHFWSPKSPLYYFLGDFLRVVFLGNLLKGSRSSPPRNIRHPGERVEGGGEDSLRREKEGSETRCAAGYN